MELLVTGIAGQTLALLGLALLGGRSGLQALRIRSDGRREPVAHHGDRYQYDGRRQPLIDALLLLLGLATAVALAGVARL